MRNGRRRLGEPAPTAIIDYPQEENPGLPGAPPLGGGLGGNHRSAIRSVGEEIPGCPAGLCVRRELLQVHGIPAQGAGHRATGTDVEKHVPQLEWIHYRRDFAGAV